MSAANVERRLAAIMFTDIVGYTALMAESEEKGLRVRERHRALVRPLVEQYHGEWVQDVGDESLSSFSSAVDAVNCALAIQDALRDEREFRVRVGIHLGDVVPREGSLHGDGVNVASRIRPLAEPGGICVSEQVYDSIKNQPNVHAASLGQHRLKNVARPVAVFAVGRPGAVSVRRAATRIRRRSALQVAATVLAALIVVALGWWAWNRPIVTSGRIRSIAVLPLENLSGDPEQEYFANGMTEAVISEFARIASLRVISRTSVMQYKGIHRPLPEIARELNVEGIVEGSALRVGDRVRITLQLIDARNDHHLWVHSYERDLRDVLALQGEIARTVAREVEAELAPEVQARLGTALSVDPAAHELYLRGTLHLAETTVPDTLEAIEYFERAIEVDPGHARAYSGLGRSYSELAFGHCYMRPHDAMPRARAAVEKAIELDPSLGSAHSTLGQVLAYYDWDWARAEEAHRRAAELSPGDARVVDLYGLVWTALGRHDRALPILERAVNLGSLELVVRFDYGLGLMYARDYERAAEEFLKVLEVDPAFPWALGGLARSYAFLGREDAAYRAWTEFFRLTARDEAWMRGWESGYRDSGVRGALRHWLRSEQERAKTQYVDPAIVALLSALASADPDAIFESLERAYEERSPNLSHTLGSPAYDSLRSDPRFQDLRRRIGLPES